MEALTSFIPASIAESPLDFPWEGANMHIGPVESQTPLYSALLGKTYNGTVLIAAGVAAWGFQRLRGAFRVENSMALCEAAFLQMPDDRLIDLDVLRREITPDEPKLFSAHRNLRELLGDALHPPMWGGTTDQPVSECFHLVHLTRHLLDLTHRSLFDSWLVALVRRVDAVAAHPPLPADDEEADGSADERLRAFRGCALPPDLLVGAVPEDSLATRFATFATQTRMLANPFINATSGIPGRSMKRRTPPTPATGTGFTHWAKRRLSWCVWRWPSASSRESAHMTPKTGSGIMYTRPGQGFPPPPTRATSKPTMPIGAGRSERCSP
jgi:hypothetical protein